SLAILLDEEGLLDRTTIFGTDINRSALASARKGILPASVVQEGAANYAKAGGRESLSHYYTAAYGHARINRRIMERITFHEHNLATDSVFVEANVILCRNVLIYFNRELQNRAGRLFA